MDVLDQVLSDARGEKELGALPRLLSGEEPRRPGIAKLRYTHDAMVDLIIANPAVSQNELAYRFGYSPSWISNVIASDAFQAKLAERAKELVDPVLQSSVEQRFKGLVMRSLEVLEEKLSKPSDMIPDQLALRALEVSSRAAGYGGKSDTQVTPQVNIDIHLETLGSRLTGLLQRRKSEVVDAEVEKIAGG